jgi:hypothetical protein
MTNRSVVLSGWKGLFGKSRKSDRKVSDDFTPGNEQDKL